MMALEIFSKIYVTRLLPKRVQKMKAQNWLQSVLCVSFYHREWRNMEFLYFQAQENSSLEVYVNCFPMPLMCINLIFSGLIQRETILQKRRGPKLQNGMILKRINLRKNFGLQNVLFFEKSVFFDGKWFQLQKWKNKRLEYCGVQKDIETE